MTPPSTPLYLDWHFWSAVIALTALVLTQVPPLRVLLKRPRLAVEAFNSFAVANEIGSPRVQIHLILSNVGGRTLRVRRIRFAIHPPGGRDSFDIPALGFFQQPADNTPVLLPSFRLAPGDEWAHIVNFQALRDREDDKNVRAWSAALKEDILKRRRENPNKNELVEAAEGLWSPLVAHVQRKFRWHAGEYRATLRVEVEPASASVTRSYRFTIFESDADQLFRVTDGYRYGAGVYYASADWPSAVLLSISEERA